MDMDMKTKFDVFKIKELNKLNFYIENSYELICTISNLFFKSNKFPKKPKKNI